MPTIDLPAAYQGRRLSKRFFWQPGDGPYTDDFWAELIDITGTCCLPNGEDTQAEANVLIDLAIAAGDIQFSIRVQPFPTSDSFFAATNPSFDPENTTADAASIAYQISLLQTRLNWLTAKGVTCSHLFIDCESFPLGDDATAGQRAARTLKFQQYTDAVRAILPNATLHWYGRGWTVAQINTLGVANGQYNYLAAAPTLNDPGDCTSTPLTMPQLPAAMAESVSRVGQTPPHVTHDGVYAAGGLAVIPWLGANRDAVDGVIADYDQDYGAQNAYNLGFWVMGLNIDHGVFYPGPGLASVATYPTLNPYWWTHFNAFVMGALDAETPISPRSITVSIRERIIRQALTVAETVTSVGTVRRWDATHQFTTTPGDCIVAVSDESSERPADSTSPVRCRMRVQVLVSVFPLSSDAETEKIVELWRGRLKRAFLPEPFLEEAGGTRLLSESTIVESPGGEMADGSCGASLAIDCVYQHDQDDDSSLGTLITTLEE